MLWSERRGPRAREVAADVATIAWVGLWVLLGIRLYGRLAELAGAGRLIRDGGIGLLNTGGEVAGAVQGVPLVGENAAARIRDAFGSAADPVIAFGVDIEQLLLIIAAILGLLLVLIAVVPWLNRYVPWRLARLERLNAAARVIRPAPVNGSPPLGEDELLRILASRALHRLEYVKLLEFTPDPFGDWAAGRFEGLVQAELDSTGLRMASLRRENSHSAW